MSNKVEFKIEIHGRFFSYAQVLSWITKLICGKEKYMEPNTIQNFMASIIKQHGTAYLIECTFNSMLDYDASLNIVKFICDNQEKDNEHLIYTRYINDTYTYNTHTKPTEIQQFCFR